MKERQDVEKGQAGNRDQVRETLVGDRKDVDFNSD